MYLRYTIQDDADTDADAVISGRDRCMMLHVVIFSKIAHATTERTGGPLLYVILKCPALPRLNIHL